MKVLFSIALVILLSQHFTYAQISKSQKQIFYCGYDQNHKGDKLCEYMQQQFTDNEQAKEIVDRIVKPLGLSRNFVVLSCPNIQNAVAITDDNGVRYIIYDNEFMEAIDQSTSNWSSISILAHEVGHHFSGHTTKRSLNLEEQKKKELEADKFSGFVMFKLGATLSQAQAGLKSITNDDDDTYSTHPSRSKRMKAIEDGFNDAKNQTPTISIDKLPSPEAICEEGYVLAKQGKLKESIEKFTAVIALNPSYQLAYSNRGYAKFLLNDFSGAMKDYENGLEMGLHSLLLSNKSNLHVVLKKFNDALITANKLIAFQPSSPDGYALRGYVYQELKDYTNALNDYNNTLQINPNQKQIYINRGNLYYEGGFYEKSIEDFSKLLNDYSSEIDISALLARRGYAWYQLKDFNKALNDYDKSIKLDPINAVNLYNRGITYLALDSYNDAIEDFDDAILIDPKNSKFYYERGRTKFFLNDYTGAFRDYEKTLEINPNDYMAYGDRGVLFHKVNKLSEALVNYSKAILLNPNYDIAYKNRGVLYENIKRYDLALKDYNKAIEINPKSYEAFNARGNTYNLLGKSQMACSDFQSSCSFGFETGCTNLSRYCK